MFLRRLDDVSHMCKKKSRCWSTGLLVVDAGVVTKFRERERDASSQRDKGSRKEEWKKKRNKNKTCAQ